MSKSIFLILSALLVGCATTPRYVVLNKQQSMFYSPEQVNELNNLTRYLIKRSREGKFLDSIYVYHVRAFNIPFKVDIIDPDVRISPFVDEDFCGPGFLNKVCAEPIYSLALGSRKKKYPHTDSFVFSKDKTYGGWAWMGWFTGRYSGVKVTFPPAELINEFENDSLTGFFSLFNMEYHRDIGKVIFATTRDGGVKVFSYNDSTILRRWTLKEFGEKYLR